MVAAIAGVATVAAGAMSADAAGDAADAQAGATAESNALQRYMYDRNVELQMPTIQAGNTARNSLLYRLGLSTAGGAGGSASQPQTYDQLRSQLLSQYTRAGTTGGAPGSQTGYNLGASAGSRGGDVLSAALGQYDPYTDQANYRNIRTQTDNPGGVGEYQRVYTGPQATSTVDEQGLEAEIQRRLAEQAAAQQAAEAAARNDPAFGALAKEYVPDKFAFTSQDFLNNKDPGYEWRLQQGQKALDRQGAAAGRFLSGRQLQASSDYNQGAASQEYGNAYNRALSTFGTNESNRFGAYQANFNNAVNPLLSLAGAATLGSQNLGSAGASMANNVGNNLTNQANATGAAGIAGANAFGSGVNNAIGGYQQNQLMNSLLNRGSVNNNPYTASSTPAWGNNPMFGTGNSGMSGDN